MQGNISVENGGTLYFKVAPYFSGNTGTYLLDVQITRTSQASIDDIVLNDRISIYPNPTKDEIFIKTDLQIEKVEIYSILGNLLILENNFKDKISVLNLSVGNYVLKIYTNEGTITSKIVKQ